MRLDATDAMASLCATIYCNDGERAFVFVLRVVGRMLKPLVLSRKQTTVVILVGAV